MLSVAPIKPGLPHWNKIFKSFDCKMTNLYGSMVPVLMQFPAMFTLCWMHFGCTLVMGKSVLSQNFCFLTITDLITICMKLPWFCHTNSKQLFCNGPLFVIALVPCFFFWQETRRGVLSFCCCCKMAENSVSLLCRTKYYNLKHEHRLSRVWQFNI